MMVGKKVDLAIEKKIMNYKNTLMEVDGIQVINSDKKVALEDISFTLHSGELLGVAGVAGSGQRSSVKLLQA